MDDLDDKMDAFFTYSIISGKSDDDEKANKRKEDSKEDRYLVSSR